MADRIAGTAVVTGGSRGVGRAVALELASRGADVAILYRSRSDLADQVVRQIQERGRRALSVAADVGDPQAVAAFFAQVTETLGPVDVLVHSAGATVDWSPVRATDPVAWAAFVGTDLIGAYTCIHHAARAMHERQRGVIIAISSIAAQMCQANNSMGAAAKAGLEALIRVVAREEGRHGIRANAIAIGLTDTDQAHEAFARWGDDTARKIVAAIPLQRIGRPEEVARLAAYLASEDGEYITGKVLQLDGGQLICG